MIYDRVIIGGGASGLYCAASQTVSKGLIMERTGKPGQKLLISGSGMCNLTHAGSIKDFISHYGDSGPLIRSALYRHSNTALVDFFAKHGLEFITRPDGKLFPATMQANDVLKCLLSLAASNGYEIRRDNPVEKLDVRSDGTFVINGRIYARKVVVASGGCSYPATGSDGSMFSLLAQLGIKLAPRSPALTPIFVQNYPYESLSGISVKAKIQIGGHALEDDLLFTHKHFSGPDVLNLSRYAVVGQPIEVSYYPAPLPAFHIQKNSRSAELYFAELLHLPKRLTSILLQRCGIEKTRKVSSLTGSEIKAFRNILTEDSFSISGLAGFSAAMVTKGGVALDQVNLKTFETNRYPGLFVIGEALDIDGDTGGYNLQFACSSGYCAAMG